MKNCFFIPLFLCFILFNSTVYKIDFGMHQLSLEEAQLILGEAVALKEKNNQESNGKYITKSTFTALQVDPKSNKLANLYYSYEKYKTNAEAMHIIQGFIQSNKNLPGFELLSGYGDRAFYHTDNENFCMVIACKENILVRLKVNKMTTMTSVAELKRISKRIIDAE